jgi:hypothetical protein
MIEKFKDLKIGRLASKILAFSFCSSKLPQLYAKAMQENLEQQRGYD